MTQKYILLLVISLSLIFSGCITSGLFSLDSNNTYKIGFVGPMSGSLAKYGAYEAVKLAQDEINAIGGINGKQLEIIYEDGKGNANDAIIVVSELPRNELRGINKIKQLKLFVRFSLFLNIISYYICISTFANCANETTITP